MEIPVISKRTDSYSIFIEHNFNGFKERFVPLFPEARKICIISDESVYPLYKDSVEPLLKDNFEVLSFVVPAGEQSKDMNVVLKIEKYLKDHDFSRGDVLIGLGVLLSIDVISFVIYVLINGWPV